MRDERSVWLPAAIAAIALWSAGGAPIHGQQQARPNPIGTATLAGRVVDHDGDRPLGGFRVTLTADGNAQRPARETAA